MRTSIIHINSYNRNAGSINNFFVYFPTAFFKLENDEIKNGKIIIEPIQCVIARSFYAVDVGNNTWNISADGGVTFITFTIPPGNYNVQTFLLWLQSTFTTWLFGWNQVTNTYYYQAPNDGNTYMYSFTNFACYLFGFNLTDTPTFNYNNPKYSNIPVNMEYSKLVLINCDLPKAKFSSVDNVLTPDIVESNILLKIPISSESPPSSTLVWRSQSKDIVSFELAYNKIDSIRFWVTNEYGIPINLIHDYTISFRITYYDTKDDNSETYLSNISDYLHYMVLNDISTSKK